MTVTNFYNEGGTYNEITINGDGAVINTCDINADENGEKPLAAPTLVAFFYDDNERTKIAESLHSCVDTRSTCALLGKLIELKMTKLSVVSSPAFIDAIIPYLGFQTTSDTLRKAISRDSGLM